MDARRSWMFICLTFVTSAAGERIMCGIAKRSQENSVNITCYFPEDVGLTKRGIQVNRLNSNNRESTNLLDCRWREGTPLCFVKSGYSFDREVTNQLTLQTVTLSSDDAEDYVYTCHILSPGLYEVVPCTLFGDLGKSTTASLFSYTESSHLEEQTTSFSVEKNPDEIKKVSDGEKKISPAVSILLPCPCLFLLTGIC